MRTRQAKTTGASPTATGGDQPALARLALGVGARAGLGVAGSSGSAGGCLSRPGDGAGTGDGNGIDVAAAETDGRAGTAGSEAVIVTSARPGIGVAASTEVGNRGCGPGGWWAAAAEVEVAALGAAESRRRTSAGSLSAVGRVANDPTSSTASANVAARSTTPLTAARRRIYAVLAGPPKLIMSPT